MNTTEAAELAAELRKAAQDLLSWSNFFGHLDKGL